jgi:hypothetical protein
MINKKPIDRFTWVHLLNGVIGAQTSLSLSQVTALAVLWEIGERPLKKKYAAYFPNPSQDSLSNSTGDVLATVVGFMLAKHLQR